ncbi:MAG: malic enzyme-like NAD(P)-binding protein [Simkaniaceae bacterium]
MHYNGRTLPIGQCNNVYIFPGVGLGIISVGAKEVTDEMFLKAAEIVSEESPMLIDPYDSLFPLFKDLRQVSLKIACAVGELAKEKG